MVTPGRQYSAGSGYRYGFNGKENDKDISEGVQDYGMRISDNRLGRFLSVDPLTGSYPELTPYQFASNTPIWAIDLDGLEAKINNNASDLKPGITIISRKQAQELTREQNNPTSLHHTKELNSINTSKITDVKQRTVAGQVIVGIITGGKVGLDQNPIIEVKKLEIKNIETIVDEGFVKYLRTEIEVKNTIVDISKGLFAGNISEIKTTYSKSLVYSKLSYEEKNGEFGVSLNPAASFSVTSINTTTILSLDPKYECNLEKLPDDLSNRVQSAVATNAEISKRAMNGVNDSFKRGEKNADDGNLIPNKGKYTPADNTPGKKNPYQH